MALREIRLEGDPILNKVARPVTNMTDRLATLIEDMIETMYDGDGVGLAAPQVGILRRIFVIDCADTEHGDEPDPMVFINPEILETSGEQTGSEGCLSVPGKVANVRRPNYVKLRAYDAEMRHFEMEAEGMVARVVLHENDHLDGHLYPEIAEGALMDVEEVLEEQDEEAADTHIEIRKKVRYLDS